MNKNAAKKNVMTESMVGSVHPLKGLLMDKGADGLNQMFQQTQQRLIDVQISMKELLACHSAVRDELGVNCLNLILVRKLNPGVHSDENNPIELLTYEEQWCAQFMEWRGTAEWATTFGYNSRIGIRVFPFELKSVHTRQVKEFIFKRNKNYYEALLAIESMRVTLNAGARMLRKQMTELASVRDEKMGLHDFELPAVNRYAQRLIKTLRHPSGLEVAMNALNSL